MPRSLQVSVWNSGSCDIDIGAEACGGPRRSGCSQCVQPTVLWTAARECFPRRSDVLRCVPRERPLLPPSASSPTVVGLPRSRPQLRGSQLRGSKEARPPGGGAGGWRWAALQTSPDSLVWVTFVILCKVSFSLSLFSEDLPETRNFVRKLGLLILGNYLFLLLLLLLPHSCSSTCP